MTPSIHSGSCTAAACCLAVAAMAQTARTQDAAPVTAMHAVLSEQGSTRATGYSMSCKILRSEGKLFAAWLDHLADIRVRTRDLESGRWSKTVLVGQGVDNHSGPAITMDSQGFLSIIFGPHHGPFQLRKSSRPRDASSWDPALQVGINGTYPSLVCGPDDTLYLTYRGGAMPRRLMFQKCLAGDQWTAPVELVDANVPGGYTQYGNALAIGPDGTLHLGFHVYDHHPAGGKAAGYLRSKDGGENWLTADGTPVSLPVTPAAPCFFAQDENLDMRVSNLAVDPEGRPHLLTSQLRKRPVSATLWHHDGSAWRRRDMLEVVQSVWPDRAVGMHGTLTFDAAGRLYIGLVTAALPGGGWGHASWNVVLLFSRDGGRTFHCREVATPRPGKPNWLTSIERPYNHRALQAPPAMLYTEGGPGEGCTGGPTTTVHFVQIEDNPAAE